MSTLKSTLRLVASTRQFSRTAIKNATSAEVNNIPEGYKKLKLIQAKFQKPDGLPVHLKGGPVDKVLYGLTAGLCVVAIGMIGKLIFELSNPPKLD